jgi:hypothetical protein
VLVKNPIVHDSHFDEAWQVGNQFILKMGVILKAYDRVPRQKLWGVLQEYGIDGQLLASVKSLYNCSEICVREMAISQILSPWVLDSAKGVFCLPSFS